MSASEKKEVRSVLNTCAEPGARMQRRDNIITLEHFKVVKPLNMSLFFLSKKKNLSWNLESEFWEHETERIARHLLCLLQISLIYLCIPSLTSTTSVLPTNSHAFATPGTSNYAHMQHSALMSGQTWTQELYRLYSHLDRQFRVSVPQEHIQQRKTEDF